MAQDDVGFLGDQLGRRVGSHFRLTDIVFHQQFHLFSQNAPFGIDVRHDQLCCPYRRDSVGGEIPAVGAGNA